MIGTTSPTPASGRPRYMTSGKISHDPSPYIDVLGFRWAPEDHEGEYEPRPEFDNHDPIIASFRGLYQAATPKMRANAARHYLASVRDMRIALGLSAVQANHSRRVLTLIANVYEKK